MICEATRVFFYASLLPCCQDQKVSWHATPFEERLLKVLSDEKPRHERFVCLFFSVTTLRVRAGAESCLGCSVFRFGVLLVTGAARCVRMKWNHVGVLMPVCNCMVVHLARRISGKLIHLEENAE